jgi:predicted phosphatase
MDLQNVQQQSIEVLSILSEIEVDLIKVYRRLYKSGIPSYKDKMFQEIMEHIKTKQALKLAYAARTRIKKLAERKIDVENTTSIDTIGEQEADILGEYRVIERKPKHVDPPSEL